MDEQYLACLIESALCGLGEPQSVSRTKIKRILTENPALAARLETSKQLDNSGNIVCEADIERVKNVVLKLARGHIAYELSLPKLDNPDEITILPIVVMSDKQRSDFESPTLNITELWPEIGSRAFIRAAKQWSNESPSDWIVVQPGRYRYTVGQSSGDFAQIILSEYLACRVAWQ